jgi:hypothetical protein
LRAICRVRDRGGGGGAGGHAFMVMVMLVGTLSIIKSNHSNRKNREIECKIKTFEKDCDKIIDNFNKLNLQKSTIQIVAK